MNNGRKILGATLIGLGILADSREARIGLALTGAAVLYPKETMQILEGVKNELNKSSRQYSTLRPAPVAPAVVKNEVGLIRRFGKWSARQFDSFCKWIY